MPPPIVTVLPARHSCDELHSIGSRSPGAPRAWKTGCVRKRTFYSCAQTGPAGWQIGWRVHTQSADPCVKLSDRIWQDAIAMQARWRRFSANSDSIDTRDTMGQSKESSGTEGRNCRRLRAASIYYGLLLVSLEPPPWGPSRGRLLSRGSLRQ